MAARKKSGGEELVIGRSHAGGRNGAPQKRRAPKGGYTKKQKALFLEVLADTSNVSEACRAIGKHPGAIYALRRRDAAFADAWMKALEEGFVALEMEMLRRARFGQDVTEYRPVAEDGNGDGVAKREEVVKRVHSYANILRLQLLTQYAHKVAEYRMAQRPHVTEGAQAVEEQ